MMLVQTGPSPDIRTFFLCWTSPDATTLAPTLSTVAYAITGAGLRQDIPSTVCFRSEDLGVSGYGVGWDLY
jgi:hypothetical protein